MSTSPIQDDTTHEVKKPESVNVESSGSGEVGGAGEGNVVELADGAVKEAAGGVQEAREEPAAVVELKDGDASGTTAATVEAQPSDNATEQPKDTPSTDKTETTEAPPTVAARVPTPSSRTSTPPVPSKKKFSSVSVTKEFLSKAVSPVPAPAKLVRPAPAAPSQSTPKLLSSKLTTVPSSKPSTSPNPAGSAAPSSSTSSPWAKPAVLDSSMPLQHPAPTRGGLPNVGMGSGHGLGKRAWGPISANESRRMGPGISRDFPTAKEVAEGKRKAMLNAQVIAQAEAAHNQAILADLNAFTHIEANAHRWDEEDEDEEIIDFGDGRTYSVAQPPRQPEPAHDEPVAKSERFGEDIGRSWPPRADAQPERVLFNANSNRLEPSSGRQQQPPPHEQPVRLMSRDAPPHAHDRAAPPHMADSRPLPPHLNAPRAPPANSWRQPLSSDREVPPHLAGHREPRVEEHHAPVSRPAPPSTRPAPTRAPPSQIVPPKAPSVTSPVAPTVPLPAVIPPADEQAAEMHSAAEKARLRRLAEEAEREAAAERARQKARELAERFGSKPAAPAASAPALAAAALAAATQASKPAPPPGLDKPAPQFTIAARPKPVEAVSADGSAHPTSAAPADAAQSWRRSGPLPEPRGKARRPSNDPARLELQGRDARRMSNASQQRIHSQHEVPPPPPASTSPVKARDELLHEHIAAPIPQVKREANFDTTLARLQAAMKHQRTSPPPGVERRKGQNRQALEAVPDGEAEPAASLAQPPAPTAIKTRPKPAPPRLPFLPPDFFNATQLEIPRSPPPAWRLYTVKLPSTAPPSRGNIQRWRLKQFEAPRASGPKGWWMTYDPPIAGLPPTHYLPDFLLPQPIGRRFAKLVDTGPIISISPRRLTPYQRRSKRRPTLETTRDAAPPAVASASVVEPSQTEPTLHPAHEPLLPQQKGHTRLPNVNPRLVAPQPSAAEKPAVRFMVSSELDGDSLLEEVNKMSLEHIGEADDKGSKGVEHRKPGTPPPSNPQKLGSISPNAAQGPWAKSTLSYNLTSPARSDARSDVQQRERVKSVWEQTSEPTAKAPAAPSQPDTPLYPSLNSPAVVPEAAKFPAAGQQSSAFGPRSSFSQAAGYGQFIGSGSTSPEGGGMGVNYGLMNRNGSANGFQQGLWAPAPGFGNSMASPSYGYRGMEKTGSFSKDAQPAYSSEFRYGQQQQQGQQGYNGFQPQQYRQSYGYNSGFGAQMGTPMAAAPRGRFPNAEFQGMGYDQSYFQNQGYEGAGGFAGGQQGQHAQGQGQGQGHGQAQQLQQQQQQGQQGQQGQGQQGQQRAVRKMW